MNARRYRRPLVFAAVMLSVVALLSAVPAAPARAATGFVVLQMNLCNSGLARASCYSFGRSIDEAVDKIGRYPPDLVTLQEICRDDLYAGTGFGKLARAVADRYGSRQVSVDFVPARNRYTGQPYRCTNGQQFGDAVIVHGTPGDRHSGWYDSQDDTDEIRAWTCTTVVRARLTGCTTHLSTEPDIAVRQCHELMAILAAPWVQPEVIVAGDFNLSFRPGQPHNAQDCAPAGYHRVGDSALQQVFFAGGVRWLRSATEPMRWTDHPLLYARFRV